MPHPVRLLLFLGTVIVAVWLRGAVAAVPEMRIDLHARNQAVSGTVHAYEDPTRKAGIDEIAAMDPSRWTPRPATAAFGLSRSAWWIHFRLVASQGRSSSVERLLEAGSPLQDFVSLYLVRENGRIEHAGTTGDRLPFKARPFHHRNPAFVIDIPTGEAVDVYLRLDTHDGLFEITPLTLWERQAFIEADSRESLVFGLYYGGVLALFIYNLFLYASTRQPGFGLYAAYLFAFFAWNFTFRGFSFQYLWPDSPNFGNQVIIACSSAALSLGTLFSVVFLRTAQTVPRMHRWLKLLAALNVVCALPGLAGVYAPTYAICIPVGIVSALVVVGTGIYLMLRGDRPARYFVLAWLALGVAIAWYSVSVLLGARSGLNAEAAIQIGSAAEFLLLAFGLADAMNRLRADKLHAEQQARLAETEKNRHLLLAKEAAESANHVKDQVVANVSHEMRTPLHGILSFSSLGMTRLSTETIDKCRTYFEKIHASGTRLNHFVENLLYLARLSAEAVEPRQSPTEVAPLLESVIARAGRALAERHLMVDVLVDTRHTCLRVDPVITGHALSEVLGNATKHAPPGSTISITVADDAPSEGRCRITVADTGPGIPDEEMESIFESFVQSSRTDRQSGGTGLGLSITRRIVEIQGGSIRARNQASGGAAFDIVLPLCQATQPSTEPASQSLAA